MGLHKGDMPLVVPGGYLTSKDVLRVVHVVEITEDSDRVHTAWVLPGDKVLAVEWISENTPDMRLFTYDSVKDYLNNLNPEGFIVEGGKFQLELLALNYGLDLDEEICD